LVLVFLTVALSGCTKTDYQYKTITDRIDIVEKDDFWGGWYVTFENGMEITVEDENIVHLEKHRLITIIFIYSSGWKISDYEYLED